jgi:hypothetical protein
MRIKIDNAVLISEIQKLFNESFPYLKIEFFSKPHSVGKASPKKLMIDNSLTLKEVRKTDKPGMLEISNSMTVSALESLFWKEFGLSVQIFRRSGHTWLETPATDTWTIEKQNKMGEEISNFKKKTI